MAKEGKNGTKGIFDSVEEHSRVSEGGADWTTASTSTLLRLIDACTSRGGAIRFGYTRDGGAYALGLYYGDESSTKYCRPSEDLESFLIKWIEFYEDLPMSNGVSPTYSAKTRK